jgi:hypothetical protein
MHKFQKKNQTSEEEENWGQSSIVGVWQHEASGHRWSWALHAHMHHVGQPHLPANVFFFDKENELCHRHIRIRVQVYPPSRRSRAPSARLLAISLSAHGCAAAESRRQPVGHAYVRVVNQLSVEPCLNRTTDNQLRAQSSPKSKDPKIGWPKPWKHTE